MNGESQLVEWLVFGLALICAVGGLARWVIGRSDRERDAWDKKLLIAEKEYKEEIQQRIRERERILAQLRQDFDQKLQRALADAASANAVASLARLEMARDYPTRVHLSEELDKSLRPVQQQLDRLEEWLRHLLPPNHIT